MSLVSVIIPAYNAERYLKEAVSSVLNQTYQNIEVILVNDGSVDKTEEIAQTFKKLDDRVRYISVKNGGVAAARNLGINQSKGEYVAFLDADDALMPENIAEKINLYLQKPEVGLVHTDMAIIDEMGKCTGQVLKGKEGFILNELLLWEETCIPAPSSILVPRCVLEEIGGFDIELSTAADQEFFFRLANKYPVARVARPLGLYRVHGENMHQNIALMEKDHILAYKKASAYHLFTSWKQKKKAFSNLYFILAGSWWVACRNKPKTFYFLTRSFFNNPFSIGRILAKIGVVKLR